MMQQIMHDRTSGAELDRLVSIISAGGVIAFPTDTFYGLGADPFNRAAIHRIYTLKGRPEYRPILLLVDSLERAATVAELSDLARRVAEAFWPGPLTIILPAHRHVPEEISAGTGTVGVRFPDAPLAVSLVSRLGLPITATSANKSGSPPCTSPEEVREQFGNELAAIVEGDRLEAKMPSTLLDLTTPEPTIRRFGGLSEAVLREFFGSSLRCEV